MSFHRTIAPVLNPDQIDDAATLLADARLNNRLIDEIPLACRPQTLADAYAIQDRLIERLGWRTSGWFCACTNPTIQSMLGLHEPYYARLLADFVRPGSATLLAAEFPPVVLECEFGFRLGKDLHPRAEPYTRDEVENAIATLHPTIEVVAGHLRNWPEQDVFSVIADNGTDGALIYGEGVNTWQELDLCAMEVDLSVNGVAQRHGVGANVLGDPLAALVWLANARSRAGDGLKAGDIHNTGTATDIYWMKIGDTAVARFAGLGEVELTLA